MRAYLQLTLLSWLLFFPGMSTLPVIERDEAHFAQASRQMLQTGEYFKIRFQDVTRFQKPPGINWLQAGSAWLLNHGDSPLIGPYRLPSMISAWLAVLMTYYFARRRVGSRVAWMAAGLLAVSLLLVVEAHMAVIDATLLLTVVLMQGALWVIFSCGMEGQRVSPGWAWLFWLALTAGVVLKGVTLLVAGLTIGGLCWSTREWRWLKGIRAGWGSAVFVLLTGWWLWKVNVAEHSNYLWQMIHRDLLPKLQGGHESHGKPPLFHLAILPLTFWPASLFLGSTFVYVWRHRGDRVVQFLLAWVLPTWLFFEMMPTKLPQYVLPTFPAIAILVSLALASSTAKPRMFERVYLVWWGLCSIGFGLSFLVVSYGLLHHVTAWGIAVSLAVLACAIVGVYSQWRGHESRMIWGVFLTALLVYPVAFSQLLPTLQPLWIAKSVAEHLRNSAISEQRPLVVSGFGEPGLVFYLNSHQVVFVMDDIQALTQCSQSHGYVLLKPSEALHVYLETNSLKSLGMIEGFNYSKGRWETLALMAC